MREIMIHTDMIVFVRKKNEVYTCNIMLKQEHQYKCAHKTRNRETRIYRHKSNQHIYSHKGARKSKHKQTYNSANAKKKSIYNYNISLCLDRI